MSKFTWLSVLTVTFSLLFSSYLFSQSSTKSVAYLPSNLAAYQQAVQNRIANGQFEGISCAEPEGDALENMARAANCGVIDNGYGTNCWSPSVGLPSNRDAVCNIPALNQPACGNFRVPIAITIFENTAWTGSNYLNGTGFVALPDVDIDAMLANLNSIYGNANMQFYECKTRQRINNPDLYNFYANTSDPENGQNDENQTAAYDTPDVINLYFVGGFAGDHDCCGSLGYAYYPPSRDFSIMRYAAVNTAIVAHELGHYFGLFHTHRNLPSLTAGGEANGTPNGLLDNCDCLTTGDGICDTWPDPNFATTCSSTCGGGACFVVGGCDFNESGYSCMNSGGSLTINPSAGVDIGTGISTILEKNIMSYNQIGNCRTAFSPCQFRKIYETLFTCRNNLCYADVTNDFISTQLNATNSPYKEICVGDAPPTFVAKSECYKWYADATGGTSLGTGSTFTPTAGTGTGQLDTNLIGTQDYWIEDINTFQSPACRRRVTISIVARPGTATVGDANLCCGEATTFVSNGVNIDTCNQTIAWWSTTTPFSGYAAAQAAFNALTPTQIANVIQNSSSITNAGTTASFDFSNNCSSLGAGTYYLTPFVSRKYKAAVPAVVLTDNTGNTSNGTFNGFSAHRYNSGALAGVPAPDPCNPRGAPTFTIAINVTSSNRNDIGFDFHPANNCSSTTPRLYTSTTLNNNGNQGVGTYTFTQAQMPDFDPATGFCFWVFGNGGNLTASFTVSISVTYPAIAEVTFPNFERACSIGNAVQFQISAPVTAPTSTNKTICQGGNTTLAAVGISGANILWYGPNSTTTLVQNSTATTYTPTIIAAGTYTYYISQRNSTGCESSQTPVTLTVNAAPSATISNVQTGCGSPILSAGIGATGQTYSWSNGATNQAINITSTGTYSVTVTQAGCSSNSFYSVTALGLLATASNNSPVCIGSHVSLSASGGTSYAWSGPNGFSSTLQNLTIDNISAANAGTYIVTVTGTSGGTTCTATAATVVTINTVDASAWNNSPVCLNGDVLLSAAGGTTYAWSGPSGFISTVQTPTITSVNSSKIGVYTVTVTNSAGCTATATTTVSNANVAVNATTNSPCLGGTINLQATGGSTYAWSGPNSFLSNLQNPTITNATAAKTGTYTVTVTTSSGCTASATVVVNLSTVSATASNTGPYCVGMTINLLVNNAGVAYSWSGPNSYTSTTQNPTISNATTSKAGVYTVTITNANGCTGTATTKVVVNTLPNASTSANVSVCQGNNATITANSTTAGVTYTWSGPDNYSATTQNINLTNVQTTQAGTYTVTVTTTASGCSATATANLNVGTASVTTSSNSPLCTGATLQLNAVGIGTFSWSGPDGFVSNLQNPSINHVTTANTGVYTVTITSANTCTATSSINVQIGTETFSATNNGPVCKFSPVTLSATGGSSYNWSGPSGFTSTLQNPTISSLDVAQTGIYSVTITAASGCTAVANTIVSISAVNASANATSGGNICIGENVTLNASSTVSGVTYAWSGPNGFSSTQQQPTITNGQTNQSGTYIVTVTNNNGCTTTASVDITITQPTGTAISNSPVCLNSTLQLSVNDSQTASTYAWSGPNNFFSTLKNPSVSNATAINAGVYTVTITLNGCTTVSSVEVIVGDIVPSASSNSPVCPGATINLFANGGMTYDWVGPNSFTSTLQNPTITNATSAKAGTYTVTVTSGGCTSTLTVQVVVNNFTATATNTPACGSANLSASGGVSYAWVGPNGFSSSTQNPTVTVAGTYTVTITNSSGCSKTATTTATLGATPTGTVASNSPVCPGNTLGFNVTGVQTGSTYTWSGPNNFTSTLKNPTITNATAANSGVYNVTITLNGCSTVSSITATVGSITATATSNSPVCRGATINLSTNGGSSYAWAGPNGFTSTLQNPSITNANNNKSGTYTVTVTSGSCTATATTVVTVTTLTATASNTPNCGGATLAATGGISYAWTGPNNFSSTVANPAVSVGGTYTVTVTNNTGCTGTATTIVAIGTSTLTATASSNSPLCAGGTLNLTTTASGGTNLVTNSTFESGNTGFSSDYIFTNSRTSAGQYGIVTNPNSWYGFFSNCTGYGGSGKMLVADGATTSGKRVWYQTITVTPNTNYQLSAYAMSVYNGTPARLIFKIGTTQVGNELNVGTSPCQWLPMSATFNSGNSTSIIISIWDNETSGTSGNNFALDNISCIAVPSNYAWSGPNGFSANIQNPSISNTTTAAAGVYTVTVSNNTGCTTTATVNVSVNSANSITATNNSPLCVGGTLNLSASGGTNYSWAGPNSYASASQNPTRSNVTAVMAGTYTVTVSTSGGCSGTATTVVTINTATATASNGGAVCPGGTITLSASEGTTYAWAGPSSFTANIQNPTSSNATTAMSGTYTVTVTNANGCTATATTSLSVAAVNATATSNSPVGIGGTLNLSASGGTNYSWIGPNGFTANIQNPSLTNVATAVSGTYTVTVTNANGCTGTATVDVSVTTQGVIATSNSPICSGGTLQLTATVTGTATAFAWSGPASFTATTQNPTRTSMTATRAGVYTVTVTFSNGSTATASTNVAVETFTLTPDYNDVVCDGATLNLYANPSGGTLSAITWSLSGVTSNAVNPSFPNATDLYQGTWSINATSTNGCNITRSLYTWVNQIDGEVSVYGDAWQNNNGTYSICRWDYLELYADNNEGGNESVQTVQWIAPNGVTANSAYVGVTVPSTTYTGTYTVHLMDGYGCTETHTFYLNVINCGNKTDEIVDAIITARPNPLNETTKIQFTASADGRTQMGVYDILGRKIATVFEGMTEKGNTYNFEFNAQQLPSGLYWLKAQTEQGQVLTYQLEVIH